MLVKGIVDGVVSGLQSQTDDAGTASASPRIAKALGAFAFASGQPVTVLLRGRPWATMEWEMIDFIGIEALPERSRVTASRAVGLGLFSLAAKKRTPCCVLTIVWGARHLIFEVPTEAHRLRGEMATAGLPIDEQLL
jgi:hypothetical protein